MSDNRRESELERKHRTLALKSGWFVAKIKSATPNGFPDRFYARAGRIVLIEWKRHGEPATRQQQLRHQQLLDAGVEVHVVDKLDDANRILGMT